MAASDSNPAEKQTSGKPSRSPVERAIVWVLIVVGLGLIAIEARAKTGYDSTLTYVQNRVDNYNAAGDVENVPALKIAELMANASGGPTLSEAKPSNLGLKTRTLKWLSLFKHYELTLVVNNDSEEAIVFNVKPTDPDPD